MATRRFALLVLSAALLALAVTAPFAQAQHFSLFRADLRARIWTDDHSRQIVFFKFAYHVTCQSGDEIIRHPGIGGSVVNSQPQPPIHYGKRGRFGFAESDGIGNNDGLKGVVKPNAIVGQFRTTYRDPTGHCWTGESVDNSWVQFRAGFVPHVPPVAMPPGS